MNIGVDARELQGRPTGVGRYLRNLLRAWPEAAGDRLFLYFNGPAPRDPILEDPRITGRALGAWPVRGLVWQEVRLPAAARADALDVFFAPAYACSLRLRIPRVVTVHDMSFFSIPEDFALRDGMRRRWLVGASLKASRRIVVVSDFTRREVATRFPEVGDRVAVVPHGADDDLPPGPARCDARARLGLRGPMLLSVGSILNRRRLPALLHAVSRLLPAWPDLVLDVVGENRTHPPLDLVALGSRLGMAERLRASGFVSDAALAERYAASDVAVYLSEYEGFGLPVLEAMSRGVPVLTSARPATGEIFAGSALLVEPQDVPGIAEALAHLLGDPTLRADLGSRGRALAARYSWGQAARGTREVLAAAAGERH